MKNLKKFLTIVLAAIMLVTTFSVATFAESGDSADTPAVITTINSIKLIVVAPTAGSKPSTDTILDTDGCKVTEVKWNDKETGAVMDGNTIFATEGTYVITATVAAEEGYAFAFGTDALKATVNGYDATISFNADGNSVTVSYSFDYNEQEDDVDAGSIFANIFEVIKTVLLTIVRFLGALVGLG